MYDRPSLEALIDAASMHLEDHVIPAVKGDAKLYFQTLVAANVLKIASRQVQLHDKHLLQAWEDLGTLFQTPLPIPFDSQERESRLTAWHDELCAAIRQGDYDAVNQRRALLQYVQRRTIAQLEVANPKFLQVIAAEEDALHDQSVD